MENHIDIKNRETTVINAVMRVVDILESLGYNRDKKDYVSLYESITETKYNGSIKNDIKIHNPYAELKKSMVIMNENNDTVTSLNLVSFMSDINRAIKKLDSIDDTNIPPDICKIRVDINNRFNVKGFDTGLLIKPDTLHLIYNRTNHCVYVISSTGKDINHDVIVYNIESDEHTHINCDFHHESKNNSFKTDIIYKLREHTGLSDFVTIYTNPRLIGFKFTDSLYKDSEQQSHLEDIRKIKDNVYLQKLLGIL